MNAREILGQVGSQRTILLLVRDQATDSFVRTTLEPYSYRILSARDEENAFFLCMRGQVDILLTHATAPAFSGSTFPEESSPILEQGIRPSSC